VKRLALLAVALLVAAACSGDDDDTADVAEPTSTTSTTVVAEPVYDGYTSDVYGDDAAWLCRPDTEDVCDDELDATAIEPDGTTSPAPFVAAEDPAIDCFYVYPTISRDPGDNSDMTPGENEELYVVRQQAARLGEVCRVFAPVYRSTTLTALTRRMGGGAGAGPDSGAIAYGDVVDAWKHYIDVDNEGRGVIIIGHSQGAGMLARLLVAEIDPNPALRDRLVSAMLIGTSAHISAVPNLHVCASDDDTGCVISYSTFRSTAPPSAGSFFARPDGDEAAICTNPAALAGGDADLHPYFGTGGASILGGSSEPRWGAEVDTPFVTLPGLVSAACVERDGFHYLELTVHPDAGPRVDDVAGDLTPEWGMHLIDVNVAMGDLVEVARNQSNAWE
jgi:hypothetical protein